MRRPSLGMQGSRIGRVLLKKTVVLKLEVQ
jgi:hypothetical protein